MKHHNLSPNKRIALGVLAVTVAVLGYFIFYRVLVSMDTKAEDKELEILSQRNAFLDILNLETDLEQNAKERDQLTSYFVTGETVVDFLNIIEAYAAYVEVDFLVDNVNADQNKLRVEVSGEGQYESVLDLLKLIEYSPFYLTIDRYDIIASNTPQDQQFIQENQDADAVEDQLKQSNYWKFEIDIVINSYTPLPIN